VPQKGQGKARAGDRSSPVRTTGVKVHGPKHRDFSTGLPRKMYDLAWRTALSWRYRKGELVVVEKLAKDHHMNLGRLRISKLVETFNGTSLGSATNPRKDEITKEKPLRTMWILKEGGGKDEPFHQALEVWYPKDKVKNAEDVDVKNLLEGKRIVIEKEALDAILKKRQKDIRAPVNVAQNKGIAAAEAQRMAVAVAETNKIKEELQKTLDEEARKLQEDLAKVTAETVPSI
jgi:large subunit ribosomal protein L4